VSSVYPELLLPAAQDVVYLSAIVMQRYDIAKKLLSGLCVASRLRCRRRNTAMGNSTAYSEDGYGSNKMLPVGFYACTMTWTSRTVALAIFFNKVLSSASRYLSQPSRPSFVWMLNVS
jgi:hypothetical protein